MCCFSRKVEHVSNTSIFARASKEGRQFLVYSMQFQAAQDLAMILPIPTPKASAEDAVTFINLEKYPDFFADLNKGFPMPVLGRGNGGFAPAAGKLTVMDVGMFEASFVPTRKDFSRLDEPFRLPVDVWEKLPQYADFGFALFKLKKTEKGNQKVHPMAFEFPRDDKEIVFFPTVHIHNGAVPEMAEFDHSLFCQLSSDAPANWEESSKLAQEFVQIEKAQGVVEPKSHIYRKKMTGMFANKDIAVSNV